MIKKNVFIFVALSIAASGLNYIVYPLFGRILAPTEYINITISLSLITQMSTFLSSIIAITIGLSKSNNDKRANEKIELLQAFLFKLFIILAMIFLAISPIIMSKLHTPVLFAVPISLMMIFSIPIQVISGYLNGKNQMIKLGIAILISASSQFIIGLATSILSHNGLLTMLSMIIAQVITLVLIYSIFSKDQLPEVVKSLKTPINTIRNKNINSLLIYTVVASLAIMAISIIQIVDLLIFQSLNNTDIKFYTDIYVISRVVFFAGMIFIWPFLGEISLDHHRFNRMPFIKVLGYFTVIALAAMIALFFFGDQLTTMLFGTNYDIHSIRIVGILAVLYKYFLLVITAAVLYFVVIRSYMAIWLSIATSGTILIFSRFIGKNVDMLAILIGLNIIASIMAIISIALLLHIPIRKTNH